MRGAQVMQLPKRPAWVKTVEKGDLRKSLWQEIFYAKMAQKFLLRGPMPTINTTERSFKFYISLFSWWTIINWGKRMKINFLNGQFYFRCLERVRSQKQWDSISPRDFFSFWVIFKYTMNRKYGRNLFWHDLTMIFWHARIDT